MQKRPILIAFVLVVAGAARAEEPSSADVAAARELGKEGAKLAEAGKCGEAIDKLRRAATIVSAPSIDVRLGECLVATGKLVEGTEVLQRVVRAPLAPGAPAVFVEARDRARRALDSALPKLGRLRIKLAAREGMSPSVTVDGVLVPAALLDVERPADPGEHVVEARAPGFIAATARINVVSGRTETVDLALAPAPVASTSASAAPPPLRPRCRHPRRPCHLCRP